MVGAPVRVIKHSVISRNYNVIVTGNIGTERGTRVQEINMDRMTKLRRVDLLL